MRMKYELKPHGMGESTHDAKRVSELLVETLSAMLVGQMAVSRARLRECVVATYGFAELGRQIGKDPKNLMRMLGPNGNPTASKIMEIFGVCAYGMNVHITVEVANDDPTDTPSQADLASIEGFAGGDAKNAEPPSRPPPLEPTLTPMGQDEMFKYFRYEGPPQASLAMPFEWELRSSLNYLEEFFVEAKWPPFECRVMVSASGDDWEALPEELEKLLSPEGSDPRTEYPTLGPKGIETGINFISRRLSCETSSVWKLREAQKILEVLRTSDSDEKLRAAHELGIFREQANRHKKDLHALTKGRKQIRSAKTSGRVGAETMRRNAQVWQGRAKELAAEYWKRKPSASTSEVAADVVRSLTSEGVVTTRKTAPSKTTVRKLIT